MNAVLKDCRLGTGGLQVVAFDDGGVRAQQAAQLPIQAACGLLGGRSSAGFKLDTTLDYRGVPTDAWFAGGWRVVGKPVSERALHRPGPGPLRLIPNKLGRAFTRPSRGGREHGYELGFTKVEQALHPSCLGRACGVRSCFALSPCSFHLHPSCLGRWQNTGRGIRSN